MNLVRWLVSIPFNVATKVLQYFSVSTPITFPFSLFRSVYSKYLKFRKQYVVGKLSEIESTAQSHISHSQYQHALHCYTLKLEVIPKTPTDFFTMTDIRNQRAKCLFSMAAVRAKMNRWTPCINICIYVLREDTTNSSTKALFQMIHSQLTDDEARTLLESLETDPRCDDINECTFDLAAIRSYCPQRGKCCAAASISGGLNSLIGRREFTTNDALDEYIALYPKYAPRLKRRSTKNIGNGNLKKAMKSLLKRRSADSTESALGMTIEFETIISGPRCTKAPGFYIVTKQEIKSGDLGRYAALISSYLQSEEHVLVAHIKNHYCLVFGTRRNVESTAIEVLIAKRGQSPKHWEKISDFLSGFAKSKIYKLYAVRRRRWVESFEWKKQLRARD